jgi:hypothetical protein
MEKRLFGDGRLIKNVKLYTEEQEVLKELLEQRLNQNKDE